MARVIVAMSGGVDSSVAAALCVEDGWETMGVTFKLRPAAWPGRGCCGASPDAADARQAAEKLGIPHRLMDFSDLFSAVVIDPFVSDYLSRRTPNPCVECNRKVKFAALLKLAVDWKADAVATGHYARVERREDGTCGLFRAADERKDQSYFLYCLTQRELARTIFPLGRLSKDEARRKARALGLATADKPESMEICFVPKNDYRQFLRLRALREAPAAFAPGDIRDRSGKLLGRHEGLACYTVGQRKGLGVAAPEPLYVSRLDGATNTLVVGTERETRRSAFTVGSLSWTRNEPTQGDVLVRVRHRGRLAPAALRSEGLGGRFRVVLQEGEMGIAPGQAAVFYRRSEGFDEVLGGGTIEEVL
ncbi:MAG: tRNA 2-thiouridine(34) synthase MnmA [Elusimicrobia bacterium]|nr:tRNA 2-thiouridine(34) synthase MnmA [Elusimicrobiota bacterium]